MPIQRVTNTLINATGNTGKFIFNSVGAIIRRGLQWSDATARGAGQAADFVGNLPLVRRVAGFLRLDWLVNISNRVDIEKAQAEVKRLQQEHPNESPSQIAHRIMVQKAIKAGQVGFVSSLIPGFAVALFAIDLAATTAIQTEMVYEIAAAYGLDLRDQARKGEVMAIFGLAVSGGRAVRAGLGFLRNIPLAGAAIGASTNATMLYSLGYAACRFYEAKLRANTEDPSPETLDALQQEGEKYMELAIAQARVMDQVLAHMILASYPDKTWDMILPELKKLQIEPDSLKAIEANLRDPKPLDALLDQLNRDYAVPLLAQCQRIANQDGAVSEKEQEILNAISQKFDGEFAALSGR